MSMTQLGVEGHLTIGHNCQLHPDAKFKFNVSSHFSDTVQNTKYDDNGDANAIREKDTAIPVYHTV